MLRAGGRVLRDMRAACDAVETSSRYDDECLRALLGHRREYTLELGGPLGLQELDLQPERLSGALHFLHCGRVVRIARVPENCHPADPGYGLSQHFQG